MKIRRFKQNDAQSVSDLIIDVLFTTNIKDYTKKYLEDFSSFMTVEKVLECGKDNHFYVALYNGKIIGCGAIGYNEKTNESSLHKLFINPKYQGKGVGKTLLLDILERDEYAVRSKKILADASITATSFYEKMGYEYVLGKKIMNEEELNYSMVKYL